MAKIQAWCAIISFSLMSWYQVSKCEQKNSTGDSSIINSTNSTSSTVNSSNSSCISNSTRFTCDDGFACIHFRYICNGIPDCPDGSDERKCGDRKCSEFTCQSDGYCVPRIMRIYDEDNCHNSAILESDEDSSLMIVLIVVGISVGIILSLVVTLSAVFKCRRYSEQPNVTYNTSNSATQLVRD